jgi:hypothetical protein
MPPNSLKDPKVGPKAKQQKNKRARAHLTFRRHEGVLELQDGIKLNSQVKVQDEVNLHNQEKKAISAS